MAQSNILYRYVKQVNFNFLIVDIIFISIIFAMGWFLQPFIYNIFYGPFEISEEEILKLAQQPNFDRFYRRGKEFYFYIEDVDLLYYLPKDEPTKISERRKAGLKGYISDSVYTMSVGNKILCGRKGTRALGATKVDGVFRPLKSNVKDMVKNYKVIDSTNQNNTMPYEYIPQDSDILDVYFDGDAWFEDGIYVGIIILGILIILAVINTIKLVKRFYNIRSHPVFKRISNIEDLLGEVERGEYVKFGKRTVHTKHWVIEKRLFDVRVSVLLNRL